jgi:tellurite resistance protein TerC
MVIGLLIADFKLVGRTSHKISMKEAGIWSGIFVSAALIFYGFLYVDQGSQVATEYLTAYTIEKILSVDNLFVFIMVFKYFNVPDEYHHKVLFWGVLGAIVMRAIFIYVGVGFVELLEFQIFGINLNIVILAFGAFLAYVGLKSGIGLLGDGEEDDEKDYSKSPGAKFIKWVFKGKIADNYDGDKFFTYKQEKVPVTVGNTTQMFYKGIKYATPLLVVVGVVEFTDLLFAVDSIPAIFSVSKNPFVLYSSNIFAILGLRAMYFLLAGMLPLFTYLNHALAIILTFIGIKMIIAPWIHIPANASLVIVVLLLIVSVVLSLMVKKEPTTV